MTKISPKPGPMTYAVLRKISLGRGKRPILEGTVKHWQLAVEIAELTTVARQSEFLGQLTIECDWFKAVREYASGAAYQGRRDLGNLQPGDGKRFAGRGLIQTTGRYNYEVLSKETGIDYVSDPDRLEKFPDALISAARYWKRKKLNALADKGMTREITRLVNGGYNHLAERIAAVAVAREVITHADSAKIEEPVKKITQSTEAQATVALGSVASLGAVSQAVGQLNEAVTTGMSLLDFLKAGGWLLLVGIAVIAAVYLFKKRSQRLAEEGT